MVHTPICYTDCDDWSILSYDVHRSQESKEQWDCLWWWISRCKSFYCHNNMYVHCIDHQSRFSVHVTPCHHSINLHHRCEQQAWLTAGLAHSFIYHHNHYSHYSKLGMTLPYFVDEMYYLDMKYRVHSYLSYRDKCYRNWNHYGRILSFISYSISFHLSTGRYLLIASLMASNVLILHVNTNLQIYIKSKQGYIISVTIRLINKPASYWLLYVVEWRDEFGVDIVLSSLLWLYRYFIMFIEYRMLPAETLHIPSLL